MLEYTEAPTPVPGPGEVLVKAHTIGVSMPEVLVRRGTYAKAARAQATLEAGEVLGKLVMQP